MVKVLAGGTVAVELSYYGEITLMGNSLEIPGYVEKAVEVCRLREQVCDMCHSEEIGPFLCGDEEWESFKPFYLHRSNVADLVSDVSKYTDKVLAVCESCALFYGWIGQPLLPTYPTKKVKF